MLAQGFLDLFCDPPHLEYFLLFFELSTKAAFAKVAFDTLRFKGPEIMKRLGPRNLNPCYSNSGSRTPPQEGSMAMKFRRYPLYLKGRQQVSETKNQPREEVFCQTSLRTSGQKLESGPPNPGKSMHCAKHFAKHMPRGRPRKNIGLKNFGLIFPSPLLSCSQIPPSRFSCTRPLLLY